MDDLIGINGIADLFDVTDTRVREWHGRNTDGFAALRLAVPDPNLKVYSERDVKEWGIATGRLTPDGQPIKRRPGPRPRRD